MKTVFSVVRSALLAAGLISAATSVSAATLLGTGTYLATDDLTRIDDGGTVLQFLDLTATIGQSASEAAAAYASAGFSVAGVDQMVALLDAFGMIYPFVPSPTTGIFIQPGPFYLPSGGTSLDGSLAERTLFVDLLGNTSPVPDTNPNRRAFGYFDGPGDFTQAPTFPFSYVGVTQGNSENDANCDPCSFASSLVSPSQSQIGVFLFRVEATNPNPQVIPLPAGLPLVLSGLGALWFVRRRARG